MTVLRAAHPADAGVVGGILAEFVDTTDWMPRIHTRAQDIAHASDLIEYGWVTVAQVQNQIVAFAACSNGQLQALYVANAFRGRGIGALLLTALKDSESELTLWTFQQNEDAQRFYLRHGFSETKRTNGAGNDEKLPDIQYFWQGEPV